MPRSTIVLGMTSGQSEVKEDREEKKESFRSRFLRHCSILIWKCYLQRQRKWGLLVIEAVFSAFLFLIAIIIAKPVFLTALEDQPEPPLTSEDILASINSRNILGYAPNIEPYVSVMNRAAVILGIGIMSALDEDELNQMLYNQSRESHLTDPVIWIIWQPKKGNFWSVKIRSTERARLLTSSTRSEAANPHLRAGFLAIQLAVSQAVIEYSAKKPPNFEVSLAAMPVSPLMEQSRVRKALSGILLCFTLALIPPVLETEALVVIETTNSLKRALRLRNVGFSSMYISWIVYAYFTALPSCMLGAVTLILIFRWLHLFVVLLVILAYASVMIMLALMMAMFHNKAFIACVWTTLFTLLQTYLAELLVHHQYDLKNKALTFGLHLIIPPLGLVHAFNEFALLQTGRETKGIAADNVAYMVISWGAMNILYFGVLMLLQRTLGQQRAIGGQVSWKSIIFKKTVNKNKLHEIEPPHWSDRGKLQEVDEFVAKAISFRNVCKSIMGVPVLSNLTFDIYRGEFTILSSERIQEHVINTLDDLLTGIAFADHGTINVLGQILKPGNMVMTSAQMMGYCHRAEALIEDLTVQEHLTLFIMISLWNQSKMHIFEYGHIRSKRLLEECNLQSVRNERVRNLHIYYKAQLCWALAMLLEPRVIIIPSFSDHPVYMAVINDKIVQFKKYITIVSLHYHNLQYEFADRIFVFDNKILAFGGTPAYMFFRYGREYRVRMTLKSGGTSENMTMELLDRAEKAGATVRAHLGSLLILRLPATPTATVAALVKDLTENSSKYGLTSFNISVADSEEVSKRAITESRQAGMPGPTAAGGFSRDLSRQALKIINGPAVWRRQRSVWNLHFRSIMWKFFTFHLYHKLLFTITLMSAIVAGAFIGLSLSALLIHMDPARTGFGANKIIKGEFQTLTVESLKQPTNLVLRADGSLAAQAIAKAYVMSQTKATYRQVKKMKYTALRETESLTEYLVNRAIDSPQQYVFMYAYGMNVYINESGSLVVQALYCPLHKDHGAAARSLARVYMALMRYYTGTLDATIQIDDDPLALDLSTWMKDIAIPPLFIQFLLIMTISHITLLPSKEFGLVRHVQKHAFNFSPARYWFTLYCCDLILYWILVVLVIIVMITIMYLTVPMQHFQSTDLMIVPFMLVVYGIVCVPQAYLFSLGPRMALNTMTFVIVNLVFGETTIVAKIFYGDTLNYVLSFMNLSPQFNMAYAYVKMKQIFLYNSECNIYHNRNLCKHNTFHKCCPKCGVLEECFARRGYLNRDHGVLMELIAMFATTIVFTTLLMLIEYRIFKRMWSSVISKLIKKEKCRSESLMPGAERERKDVLDKNAQLNGKRTDKVDTFGEYLLAVNLTRKYGDVYAVRNVYLGLGKGEALALTGLKRHGRTHLCEMLAGYKVPYEGDIWCLSRWTLKRDPHLYCQNISISCERTPLPAWMTVRDAMELIASLRGIPRKYVRQELNIFLEALELQDQANHYICDMLPNDRTRLHFAAAVIGAPPIIVVDECTAYQKYSVRRAMYIILYTLRKRGRAIFISSSSIESFLPVTNRLAIIRDGCIYDVDMVDNLVERHSMKGYTVVVHLKDEVDVSRMFARHFQYFSINDTSEVLVNVQVYDSDLTWATIFERMEALQEENYQVYTYIVTVIPIDYIFNSIISNETGNNKAKGLISWKWLEKILLPKPEIKPPKEAIDNLMPFEQKYDITKLKELPWSVIFHR